MLLHSPFMMHSLCVQSSAYLYVLTSRSSGTLVSKSSMWILNKVGERADPCGTPAGQPSGVTLYQGAPGSKFSKAPLVEMPKARVERRRAHEFSKGSRACSPGKFLNLESLKCHFPDFRERFYRILMVRKRHCNISEASLANVFALQLEPGGPHFVHILGLGAPGFARSEPIVVTPLGQPSIDESV